VKDPELPVIFATAASGARRPEDPDLPPHVGIEVLGTGATISQRYRRRSSRPGRGG
jgi:hypothetical protein